MAAPRTRNPEQRLERPRELLRGSIRVLLAVLTEGHKLLGSLRLHAFAYERSLDRGTQEREQAVRQSYADGSLDRKAAEDSALLDDLWRERQLPA